MTSWKPEPLSPRGPVYLAIADALSQDVRGGRLRPGEKLPTHRALARLLGINVVTVTRAYAEAARRGLVEGEVGRGTFVRQPEKRLASLMPIHPEDDSLVDLSFNMPAAAAELFDLGTWLAKESGVVAGHVLESGYVPAGLPEHREVGAEWLSRFGLEASPDRVLITSGGQHAMSAAFSALCDPGDVVLTEELTYPGMKALAAAQHLRLHPVRVDSGGLVPDALEEACLRTNAKALYTMPTLQNPTGTVLTAERREAIVEIARKNRLMIVEDDTTGFLVEDAPRPFASLAPDITLFLTSTSKALCAGLRTGYLVAPAAEHTAWVGRLSAVLAAISWMSPALMAEITTHLVRSGKADRIMAAKRREGRERWKLFQRILGEHGTDSAPESSFVWLPLPDPWRGAEFAREARESGVAVQAAEVFVVGRAPAPHAIRICIGTPPARRSVEGGLKTLAGILSRAPSVCRALV